MLSYNDLKPGIIFIYENDPCEVLEASFLRMQQRKSVMQTKIKNLITNKVLERNFHQNESFEEVEIEKVKLRFIYSHRGQYWFSDISDTANRFFITEEQIGPRGLFLKPNTEITAIKFKEKIIGIKMPVKMELKVKETPPGEKGDTATGGSKPAILETGAMITVPLFVKEGDAIIVNSETGEYVERVAKN